MKSPFFGANLAGAFTRLCLFLYITTTLPAQVVSLLGYSPFVGYEPVGVDGKTLLIDSSTGKPFLKCAIPAGPAGPQGPQGVPGVPGPQGPAGTSAQIKVAPPLVYNPATQTISCPTCVVTDSTGSVTLTGQLVTGFGSTKATQLTFKDSTGKSWYICVNPTGSLVIGGTQCAP